MLEEAHGHGIGVSYNSVQISRGEVGTLSGRSTKFKAKFALFAVCAFAAAIVVIVRLSSYRSVGPTGKSEAPDAEFEHPSSVDSVVTRPTNSGQIRISVRDELGQLVTNTFVTAIRLTNEGSVSGSSDIVEGLAAEADDLLLQGLLSGRYIVSGFSGTMVGQTEVDLRAGQTATAHIRLTPVGAGLVGVVLDKEDNPIPGARVRAWCRRVQPCAVSVQADGHGLFKLPLGPGAYSVVVQADGFAEERAEAVLQKMEHQTFRLEPAASLSGLVKLGAAGPPEKGATVVLYSFQTGHGVRHYEATAGDDGLFTISGISSGRYTLYAVSGAALSRYAEQIVLRPGAHVDHLVIEMRLGANVSGKVVDAHGGPVANVEVALVTEGIPPFRQPVAMSGPDGEFHLRGAFEGMAQATVATSDWWGESAVVRVGEGRDAHVNVVVDRLITVGVRAVTPSGRPVSVADVRASFQGACTTADDGVCALKLRPGRASLEVEHPTYGFGAAVIDVRADSRAVTEVVLEQFSAVVGLVQWEDGSAAARVLVQAAGAVTTTNDAGEFELLGLRPGLVSVQASPELERGGVWHDRGAKSTALIQLGASDRQVANLVVAKRSAIVGGHVFWPNGTPAADVRVGAICSGGDGAAPMSREQLDVSVVMQLRYGSGWAFSWPDGSFEIRRVCDRGVVTVWAEEDGFPPTAVHGLRPGSTDARIVLSDGGVIVGRVTLPEGAATQEIEVRAYRESGALARAKHARAVDGAFRLTGLQEGKYMIDVSTLDGLVARITSVEVHPGKPLSLPPLRLRKGRTVEGRVLDDNGRAIVGAAVSVSEVGENAETRIGVTDAGGGFLLAGLYDGALRLHVVDFVGQRETSLEIQTKESTVHLGDIVVRGAEDHRSLSQQKSIK